MTNQLTTYKGTRVGSNELGRQTGQGLPRQVAFLLLLAMLTCLGWLAPERVSAATNTYYFQNVESTSVCAGTSTGNQTTAANVPATGTAQYVNPKRGASYYVHVKLPGSAGVASSLADDMYTPAYSSPMTITSLQLSLSNTYSGGFPGGFHTLYAKIYDVDGNATCPPFEKGVLIAQTPTTNWTNPTGMVVNGLLYNMLPGHRIRVEIWSYITSIGGEITFRYGPGYGTGLVVTETPTVTDTCTVGPGVDPPDTAIVGAGLWQAAPLDSFTVQTSTGSDPVQKVTVTLAAADSWQRIESIAVKSDDGAITYGTVSNPDSDVIRIPLTTAITATTTPVQYKIWVTSWLFGTLPPPIGTSYEVRGTVTQLDSAYTKIYNDTTSAVLTITDQGGTGTAIVGDSPNPADKLIGIFYNDTLNVQLNNFTLTSWPPSHLNSVTVTFPPGRGSYLSQVYLYNGAGAMLRSATPTSDTVVLSGLDIPLTNAISPFSIRLLPNQSSPPPAGTETTVTGTVTAITLDNSNMNIAYNDTASATITIDHKAPDNPVLQYATPLDAVVNIRWTNPADPDIFGSLILRNTVPVIDVPQDGSSYSGYSGNIGTSQLIHSSGSKAPSSAEIKQDWAAVNGTTYYYKLFSRDRTYNYSTGISIGPVTPDVTVTVGSGTESADKVIVPGGSVESLDAFTLTSTMSSASISSVTVTLSSGSPDVVGSMRVVSGDGATVYGSVANPASETVTISTTGLGATNTSAGYRIEITPKTHVGMPAVPGAEVAVTGLVTAVTTAATSYKVYNDTASATLTMDNLSPANPAGAAAISLNGGFSVSWANPPDADFSSTLVLRDSAPVADLPVEGVSYNAGMSIGTSTVAYVGNLPSFIERGLTNGASYYYRLFARDSHGNYSAGGSPIGPLLPLSSDRTVAGDATATMQGLDAINVTMPYTDDANGNGTCAVEYKLSTASTWLPWTTGVSRAAGNCTATIPGLEKGIGYDVRMTHDDSDGVLGTASQTVTGIVALSLIQTSTGGVTAAFDPNYAGPTTIVVMALFTNDYNHNNSCTLEYKLSSDNNWMPGSEIYLQAAGTYFGFVNDLQLLTRYDVRLTFIDPDGVNGEAVRIITGVISPSQKNPKLIHNSLNVQDINDPNPNNYWGPMGWGIPGGMYGEFTCLTCHTRQPTPNASGIRTSIMGRPVLFKGTTGPYSFGDDSAAASKPDWETGTYKICQVCHTQTYGRIGFAEVEPGVWEPFYGPIHRNTMSDPSNHAISNGQDCTECHPHDNGFGVRMGP